MAREIDASRIRWQLGKGFPDYSPKFDTSILSFDLAIRDLSKYFNNATRRRDSDLNFPPQPNTLEPLVHYLKTKKAICFDIPHPHPNPRA